MNWGTLGDIAWYTFLVIIHVLTLGVFIPWWVAVHRGVPNYGSVIVVNVCLGWTVIGWAVALAMACRTIPEGATNVRLRHHQQQHRGRRWFLVAFPPAGRESQRRLPEDVRRVQPSRRLPLVMGLVVCSE